MTPRPHLSKEQGNMGRLSAKRKDSETFPPLTIELGVLLLRVVAGTATSERDEPGGTRHRAVCNYCGGKSNETHANAYGVLDLPIAHLEQDCPGKLAKDLWNREGLDILRAAVCHETDHPSTATGRCAQEGAKERRESSERFWAARAEADKQRAELAHHDQVDQAGTAAAPAQRAELAHHDQVDQAGAAAAPAQHAELAQQLDQAGADRAVTFTLEAQPALALDAGAAIAGPYGGNWPGRYHFTGRDGTTYRIGLPPIDRDGRYVD